MITVDFTRLDIRPGYRVLDMGCGSGRHLGEVARFKNVFAVGSDLCLEDLCQARERLRYHEELGETGQGPWALMVSDITRLPYADHTFDVVICSEVLEHIPDHRRAVSELVRILKPGGDLVVSVPRFLPERICWALSDEYFQANGGHVRIYRKKELTALVESAGVCHCSQHYAHGLHAPYWWLKCAVGPSREDAALVRLYHSLLVWDMMKRPRLTRTLERMLDPLIGKSVVFYFKKNGDGPSADASAP